MQMPDHHDDQLDEALQAPPRLVSALKRLPQRPIFIPPPTDEAILRAARRHLGRGNELRWVRLIPWAAALATLALLLALLPQFVGKTKPVGSASSFAREDVNHDGRVDILDAFALARQLKAASA